MTATSDHTLLEFLVRQAGDLDASAIEQAPSVARELVGSLGGRAKPVVQAAKAVADGEVLVPEDPAHADLLRRFNWLDAELYDRCAGAGGQAV
jgi:hypothetical protein